MHSHSYFRSIALTSSNSTMQFSDIYQFFHWTCQIVPTHETTITQFVYYVCATSIIRCARTIIEYIFHNNTARRPPSSAIIHIFRETRRYVHRDHVRVCVCDVCVWSLNNCVPMCNCTHFLHMFGFWIYYLYLILVRCNNNSIKCMMHTHD